MPKVDTKDAKGAKAGSVELDDAMFGIEPNIPVMHQVVTAQLAAKRRGTQSTNTRAEVRGGRAAHRSGSAVASPTPPSRATTRSGRPRR